MEPQTTDEAPHPGATIDEWLFAAWSTNGKVGVISGHRLIAGRAWYWAALVQYDRSLLHLAEWDVPVRSDPFVVKAPEMWAEHHCVAPLEQWTIGNEGHAVELDDPDEALRRGYGVPTPMAFDLEWYATATATEIDHGYEQAGVVHGVIELAGVGNIDLVEVAAHRWRRWSHEVALPPVELGAVMAHAGLRAPFGFPDGAVADWVLTPRGWRQRMVRR